MCPVQAIKFANNYRLHKYQVTNEQCVDISEGIMRVHRVKVIEKAAG